MTLFGRFACASLAVIVFSATESAGAASGAGSGTGSGTGAIYLQCDGDGLAPFCAALGNALQRTHPLRQVTLSPQPGAPAQLTVRFEPTRQTPQLLSGFLVWRDAAGTSGQGPEVELAVMDSVINPVLLESYAQTLVQHSNIPL